MNIGEVLSGMAGRRPDAPALIDRSGGKQRSLSFGELNQVTAAGAHRLRESGLKPGSTVLIFHPVAIELYTFMLAVFRADMTAMFVDPSAGRKLIESSCRLRQPDAFFGSPKAHWLRLTSPSVRRIPLKFHSRGRLPGSRLWNPGMPGENSAAPSRDEAPALITFTSGSTGQPKGVARSHAFLFAQHRALERAMKLEEGEVDLITLPVFTLANLASGLTSVLADTNLARPGEADPEKIGHQIENDHVDRIAASPAFFEALLEKPASLAPLKRIATGGAPVFPSLLDRIAKAAPNASVFAVYGSTEAEPIAHIQREGISEPDRELMRSGKGLLVGHVVPEIDLRIVRDLWGKAIDPLDSAGFSSVCFPAEAPGEIVVSGKHVLKGYLNGIGNEETKFRVGDETWHRTGDAGYLDKSGRLWLMGRCAAKMADTRGTVYPFTVECALSFFPRIMRSAAVLHRGRRVLVIEFRPDSDRTEQLAEIKTCLRWARMDRFLVIDKIPVDRRHQAKIDYPELNEWLDAESA